MHSYLMVHKIKKVNNKPDAFAPQRSSSQPATTCEKGLHEMADIFVSLIQLSSCFLVSTSCGPQL